MELLLPLILGRCEAFFRGFWRWTGRLQGYVSRGCLREFMRAFRVVGGEVIAARHRE